MEKKVWQTIQKFHMCPKGAEIVAGVSGGADSVALLHILQRFAAEQSWKLRAVHVHHGLRGAEADRDRDFVADFCQGLGVPCTSFHFDVRQEAQRRGLGEEETGRLLRYEAFEKTAGGGLIAVAHNRNDQAETMLMRLCRGAGLTGLCGIRPVRGQIIRPLLYCSRSEIEQYCEKNDLHYCQDSTNDENIYTRNCVRNEILPRLETIYPQAAAHMAQTAELLAGEEDYLSRQAQAGFRQAAIKIEADSITLSAAVLAAQHPAMQRRIFRMAMQALGAERGVGRLHFGLLEQLMEQETGKQLDLPHSITAVQAYGQLILQKNGMPHTGFCYALQPETEVFIPEAQIYVRLCVSMEKNAENWADGCTKVFDYDKIDRGLYCRTRREGDFLVIRNGRKKLKKFFIDEKIPKAQRDRLPLIACGEEILWVTGRRLSEAYRPSETTKRFLIVQIRRSIIK